MALLLAALADWLFSRKLIEYPKLKIAYSEGQIGWIPYALERADTIWEQHDSWQHSKDVLPEPPSTYYYQSIYGCFINDKHGLDSLDEIGVGNVTCETDYPHSDTSWPDTKEIVTKLGGEIRAYSRENKGSAFKACIPSVAWPETEVPAQRTSETSGIRVRENMQILVVDDVAWNAQVFANYIRNLKGTTALASNGLEAIKKVQEFHRKGIILDCIIMDYDMPVMNGKEALIKIREYEKLHGLKRTTIIIISGHVDSKIIGECCNLVEGLRADHFLRKPVSFEQLREVLSKVR